jgi:serine/threonine protein kinase
LKALPEALARDAERRSRLEREARLLATLNHSGIAAIHGLEDEAGFLYLVMELVEGESLDRRLERGCLPVRQALEAGRQIAEALESAHAKGVIHRDLKPSNVKLTQEGRVKLLDFGLAKALASAQEKGTSERTTDLTATDAVVGTAPYMSPEQVRGESLDRRTDI